MNKEFVRVIATVDCKWEGLPPTYRVFVNDELVCRTYLDLAQLLLKNYYK
jgi:hypothetical protein